MVLNIFFHLFPLLAAFSYLFASVLYFRVFSSNELLTIRRARILLISGLIFHIIFFFSLVLDKNLTREPLISLPNTLSIIAAILIFLFLLIERHYKILFIGAFVAPLGLFVMLISAVLFHFSRQVNEVNNFSVLLLIHVVSVLAADAFLLFSFSVSVALIIKEWFLKHQRFSKIQGLLPSVSLLDRLNYFLVDSGLLLLLIGTVFGVVVLFKNGAFTLDQRLAWSLITLLVYTMLYLMRRYFAWRGSRAAWVSIFGFSTLLVSIFALNFYGNSFHVY